MVTPACTVIEGSISSRLVIERIFSNDTTTSPPGATAPPESPVRPPDGTSAAFSERAHRTSFTTSSVERGNTTAAGAGFQNRVQSRP